MKKIIIGLAVLVIIALTVPLLFFFLNRSAFGFVKLDTKTQGTWKGTYGSDGYDLFNWEKLLPSYASVSYTGGTDCAWTIGLDDKRGLQRPENNFDRLATHTYANGTPITIDVNIKGLFAKQVSIYMLDYAGTRSATVEVIDGKTNKVLNTQKVPNYHNGIYAVYNVKGHVIFKLIPQGKDPVFCSGVFLGKGGKITIVKKQTLIPETSICDLKDNKKAAVTFIEDDGYYDSTVFYNNEFKKYGLRGSVALISKPIADLKTSDPNAYHQWQDIINQGYIDVSNHTYEHIDLVGLSDSELQLQINYSRALLRSMFPGQSVVGFVAPENDTDDKVVQVIKQQHYSVRNSGGNYSVNPDNYSWYHLGFIQVDNTSQAKDLNRDVDSAIVNHSWLLEMEHAVNLTHDPNSGYPTPETFDAHFAYVASKKNDVWCDSLEAVTKYIRERQGASLKVVKNNSNVREINLTDKLPNDIFNYPLTLRTVVNKNWNNVVIKQGTKEQKVKTVTESGKKVLYFDAIPNSGAIDITPQ